MEGSEIKEDVCCEYSRWCKVHDCYHIEPHRGGLECSRYSFKCPHANRYVRCWNE
jgi:hypothetical protein